MLLLLLGVAQAHDVLFQDTIQGGLSLDASGVSTPYDGSSTWYAGDDLLVTVPSTATITGVYLVLIPKWSGFSGDPATQVAINGLDLTSATLEEEAAEHYVYALDPATYGITGAGAVGFEETGAADVGHLDGQGVSGGVLAVFYEDTTRAGQRHVVFGIDDVLNSTQRLTGLPTAQTSGEMLISAGINWQCSNEQDGALYLDRALVSAEVGGRDDGLGFDADCGSQDWNSLITVGSFGFDDTDTWVGVDGDDPWAEPGGTSTDSRLSDELYTATYADAGVASYGYYDTTGDSWMGTFALVIEIDSDDDGVRDGADNCPDVSNADQADADADAEGDACDACTDADADGYGDASYAATTCAADCDDAEGTTHPGAAELCDAVDNDCDGDVDEGEGVDGVPWYADVDGDGYGDAASSTLACDAPDGYTADASDCDDGDATISPAGAEVCDGADNDCDGTVDEASASGAATWYRDADADGYGDGGFPARACDQPAGYVTDASDCDDDTATISPAGAEACNGEDDDCDGLTDEEGATGGGTWYTDADDDGFGNPDDPRAACARPDGTVAEASDCDDADAATHPGAVETWYDGADQDCDGNDTDQDLDGYGAAEAGGDDCDDTDAGVHPGAVDAWYDGVDADCAGDSDFDADADGHDSETYGGEDCDDADAATFPGAPDDAYDGVINDCDDADEYDRDGDGYTAEVANGDDCDDANSDIHPGAAETWYDGVDQDCDGADDDQDGDGYAEADDCDDTDAAVYPGADGWTDDCEPVDVVDEGLEEGPDAIRGGGGCGCATPGADPAAWIVALGALAAVRRRRG